MTGIFEPRGPDGRAYWRIVYDRMVRAERGDLVPYEELCSLLGTDDLRVVYDSARRAAKQLRVEATRDIAPVRGKGYHVLYANEHVSRAESHKRRASRAVRVAGQVLKGTELSLLSAPEREQWSLVTRGMVVLAQALDAQAATLARHDVLIDSLQERVGELERR